MAVWQVQQAKNRLSEVIDEANQNGPQIITKHGAEAAVVLSPDEYRRLTETPGTIVDFFRQSPLVGVDLDLERDRSMPRPGPEL